MPVQDLGVPGSPSGLAEPRVSERVEGGRALRGARTVRSVSELQKAQKLEQVGRIGDETTGLLVGDALKARCGSLGAVLARRRMVRRNAMSEELEENELNGGKSTWRSNGSR